MAAAVASLTIVALAIIKRKEIIEWFQAKVQELKIEPYISASVGEAEIKAGATISFTLLATPLTPEDKKKYGEKIKDKLKEKDYEVVEGVYEPKPLPKPQKKKVIQGFYNLETQQIIEGRILEADELDEEMTQTHQDNLLAIYK